MAASTAAILLTVASVAAGATIEQGGTATPLGSVLRQADLDISGGAIEEKAKKGLNLANVPGVIKPLSDEDAARNAKDLLKRRQGAVGQKERKSNSILSSQFENVLLGD